MMSIEEKRPSGKFKKTKCKLVYGVGVNDADYNVQVFVKDEQSMKMKMLWKCPFYSAWHGMIRRCYDKNSESRYPTYRDVTVCQEWLSFNNFKEWMQAQDWKGKELDKDILIPGNKIYGKDACCFVDGAVNTFVTDRASRRGDFPIGVSWRRANKKFLASCSNPFSKMKDHIGYFNTPIEAHKAWKERKHHFALLLASQQKDLRVASALIARYAPESTESTGLGLKVKQ